MKRLKAEWAKYGVTVAAGPAPRLRQGQGARAQHGQHGQGHRPDPHRSRCWRPTGSTARSSGDEGRRSTAGGALVEMVAPSLAPLSRAATASEIKPRQDAARPRPRCSYDAVLRARRGQQRGGAEAEGEGAPLRQRGVRPLQGDRRPPAEGLDLLLATDILPAGSTEADLFKSQVWPWSAPSGADAKQVAQTVQDGDPGPPPLGPQERRARAGLSARARARCDGSRPRRALDRAEASRAAAAMLLRATPVETAWNGDWRRPARRPAACRRSPAETRA